MATFSDLVEINIKDDCPRGKVSGSGQSRGSKVESMDRLRHPPPPLYSKNPPIDVFLPA